MESKDAKPKHPRKNPLPKKLVHSTDVDCYPVEIKTEPPDAMDTEQDTGQTTDPSFTPNSQGTSKPVVDSSKHGHKGSQKKRKRKNEKGGKSDSSGRQSRSKDVTHKGRRRTQKQEPDERQNKIKEAVISTDSKAAVSEPVQDVNNSLSTNVRSTLIEACENTCLAQDSSVTPNKKMCSVPGTSSSDEKERLKHSKKIHKEIRKLSLKKKEKQRGSRSHQKRCQKYSSAYKRKRTDDLHDLLPKRLKLQTKKCLSLHVQSKDNSSLAKDSTMNDNQNEGASATKEIATSPHIKEGDMATSGEATEEVRNKLDESVNDDLELVTLSGDASKQALEQQAERTSHEALDVKSADNSELNQLTENLLSLNRDSVHLNTVIHNKPAAKKRKVHLKHGKSQTRVTPHKSLTPHKSPWKTFSLRITPRRQSTPSDSSCYTPKSTPGSNNGSVADLHTPKSTPCSARSEKKFSIIKRTPSKFSIKRRLYATMKTPEKIIDENEDVANLSFPDLSSPEFDGIRPCCFEDTAEESKHFTPKKSPGKKLLSSRKKIHFGRDRNDDDTASSCSEQLNIISDPEDDPLDAILEEKSKRVQHVQLTAKNVRSIIHQVITNEHVLDMVRNTLKEDGLGDQLKEAIFEPRLTRSMVKQAIQKGTIPLPWHLSPIKVFSEEKLKTGPQFLEMTFSESEDTDEEYMPSPEELEHAEDDEESVCSQASDFGSPFPPCMSVSSLCVNKPEESGDGESCKTDQNQAQTTSSMGPPAVIEVTGSRQIMDHTDASQKTEEEMMIAKRTRSKLPLTDTPLEVIESEFVAPDITPDMYDTNCDDTEWQEFLASLMKSQDLNDTCDEAEDPEYNFLDDNEKDNLDDEDFRNDRAVNIPKKEVDELMSELFEAYSGSFFDDDSTQESVGDPGGFVDVKDQNIPSSPEDPGENGSPNMNLGYPGWLPPLELNPHMASIVASDIMRIKHNTLEIMTSIPKLTELEVIQLQDQMRKHVQLLTQTFVQCGSSDSNLLKSTQQSARNLLLELKVLGDTAERLRGQSYMKPPNLEEAIKITELDLKSDNPKAEDLLSKNIKAMVSSKKVLSECPLTYKQMDILVSSPVFLFPQMLPDYALVDNSSCRKRVAFTHAEDNLLAMGFDQFHQFEQRYLYIHKFLLPTKQREQIRFRHKNLRARYNGEAKSALNYWYEKGHLPEFQRYFELEDVSDIKAPMYRDKELLPAWYKAYLSTRKELESCEGQTNFSQVSENQSLGNSSCVKNFKRENQSNYTGRKPNPGKPQIDRLQPIVAKPSTTTGNVIINIVPNQSTQNQEVDIGQQVIDSLMSAIGDEKPVINTAATTNSTIVPLVTIANNNQEAQPVVMLTTTQLEQLGIKVNVIEPAELDLNSASGTTADTVPTNEQLNPGHNVAAVQETMESQPSGEISNESLISHAFSEATGISLDQLNVENKTVETTDAAEQMLYPAKITEQPYKEGTIITMESDSYPVTKDDDKNGIGQVRTGSETAVFEHTSSGTTDTNPCTEKSMNCQQTHKECNEEAVADITPGQECTFPIKEQDIKFSEKETGATMNEQGKDVTDLPGAETEVKIGNEKSQVEISEPKVSKSDEAANEQTILSTSADHCSPTDFDRVSQTSASGDDSPVKNTMRVMAELAQLISPSSKISPLKWPHQHRVSFTTPQKKTPRKSPLKPLRPLGSASPSPVKLNLPKKSVIGRPRRYGQTEHRRNFNKQAQSIAPKGFVVQSYVSPVKLAAANIAAKARKKHTKPKAIRTLRTLLPKTGTKANRSLNSDFGILDYQTDGDDSQELRHQLNRNMKSNQNLDCLSETEAGNESQPDEDQLDEEMEEETDQDEDRLAQLMAASTTVRGATKRCVVGDQKRKKTQKRAALLQLLEPDLVDNDPRRDERDTAFAQGYLLKVQQAFADQPEEYEKFLKLLYEFGCSDKTPVELYFSMKELLKDHPALLSDFAGFLMPDQAKVCGCLMEHINFKRCREFLRKLEIHFSKQPHTLHRVIKAFSQWQNSPQSDPIDLMTTVKPLLKGQPYLLDEFTKFFDNEKPPESCRTVFEEVSLGDSDEEQPELDGYEEVQFPEGDDDDVLCGTKLCRCNCHDNGELKFAKRRVHCRSCAVRVVRGHVYLQSNDRDFILQPSVIHHSPDHTPDDEMLPNPTGDEELVENIPPTEVSSKHKSSKKLKVKLPSSRRLHVSSPEKVPSSDANSMDGFIDHGDASCEDVRRLNDLSQSVSPQVLSCGEEAILSPEGVTCQMSNPSSGTVLGPTDFSHMRQEFRKSGSTETEQIADDCIMKDSSCDVIAPNVKVEDDENANPSCQMASEASSSYNLPAESRDNSDKPDKVKSEMDRDDAVPTPSAHNDVSDGATQRTSADKQENDEMDICSDQSSDDNNVESEDSQTDWTREDDRLILETCRRDGTGTETFQTLAARLGKSTEQVTQRFIMMINLLAEDEEGTEASEGEGEE